MSTTDKAQTLSPVNRHQVMLWAGALALLSLPIHLMLSADQSVAFAALMLSMIAGVYAGFALNDGRMRIIILECMVALLFFAGAVAGLFFFKWAIPILFAAHGLWDFAHHRHISTQLPHWYPSLCAVFDWIIALALTVFWLSNTPGGSL